MSFGLSNLLCFVPPAGAEVEARTPLQCREGEAPRGDDGGGVGEVLVHDLVLIQGPGPGAVNPGVLSEMASYHGST